MKMKALKRILSMLMTVLMLAGTLSMLFVNVGAAETQVTSPIAYSSASNGDKLLDVDFTQHFTAVDDTSTPFDNNGQSYDASGNAVNTFTQGWRKNLVDSPSVATSTELKVEHADTTGTADHRYIGYIPAYDLDNKTLTLEFEYFRSSGIRSKFYFGNGSFIYGTDNDGTYGDNAGGTDTNMPNLGLEVKAGTAGYRLMRQSNAVTVGVTTATSGIVSSNGEESTTFKVMLKGGTAITKTLYENYECVSQSSWKKWTGTIIPVSYAIAEVTSSGSVINVMSGTFYQPAGIGIVFGIGEYTALTDGQYYGVRNLDIYKGCTTCVDSDTDNDRLCDVCGSGISELVDFTGVNAFVQDAKGTENYVRTKGGIKVSNKNDTGGGLYGATTDYVVEGHIYEITYTIKCSNPTGTRAMMRFIQGNITSERHNTAYSGKLGWVLAKDGSGTITQTAQNQAQPVAKVVDRDIDINDNYAQQFKVIVNGITNTMTLYAVKNGEYVEVNSMTFTLTNPNLLITTGAWDEIPNEHFIEMSGVTVCEISPNIDAKDQSCKDTATGSLIDLSGVSTISNYAQKEGTLTESGLGYIKIYNKTIADGDMYGKDTGKLIKNHKYEITYTINKGVANKSRITMNFLYGSYLRSDGVTRSGQLGWVIGTDGRISKASGYAINADANGDYDWKTVDRDIDTASDNAQQFKVVIDGVGNYLLLFVMKDGEWVECKDLSIPFTIADDATLMLGFGSYDAVTGDNYIRMSDVTLYEHCDYSGSHTCIVCGSSASTAVDFRTERDDWAYDNWSTEIVEREKGSIKVSNKDIAGGGFYGIKTNYEVPGNVYEITYTLKIPNMTSSGARARMSFVNGTFHLANSGDAKGEIGWILYRSSDKSGAGLNYITPTATNNIKHNDAFEAIRDIDTANDNEQKFKVIVDGINYTMTLYVVRNGDYFWVATQSFSINGADTKLRVLTGSYDAITGDNYIELSDVLITRGCSVTKGDTTHKCSICGKTCGTHSTGHSCLICMKATSCSDGDSDHLCDTCGIRLSNCAAASGKHTCSTCGAILSMCYDTNLDHKCDRCSVVLHPCYDTKGDGDHKCDWCNNTELDTYACADNDKDHRCDDCYKTGFGTHEDGTPVDGKCEYCGKFADHTCIDEPDDGDHECDYEICVGIVNACGDSNKDHVCDTDSACTVYSTGENAHEDNNGDYKCDYCGKWTDAFISVDVVWTEMSFTFEENDWNIATHTYDDRSWTVAENGGTLTVTNNSNVHVLASFSYLANAGFTSIGMEFRVGEDAITTQNIPINETITVTVQPTGEPNEHFGSAEIGTMTITITKNGEVVNDE